MAKKRWDGSLTEADLRKLDPDTRKRILQARQESLEDEQVASQALGLRRSVFNKDSVYD